MTHAPADWIWGSSPVSDHYFIYLEGQKAGEDGIAVVKELAHVKEIVQARNAHTALVSLWKAVRALADDSRDIEEALWLELDDAETAMATKP